MLPSRTLTLALALVACAPVEPAKPPTPPAIAAAASAAELVVLDSPHTYRDTTDRGVRAVHKHGWHLLTVMDHAALAQLGAQEPPPEPPAPIGMMVFGKPELHGPLIEANRLMALELPFKALIWTEGEQVRVGWYPPSQIAARYGLAASDHGLPTLDSQIAELFADIVSTAYLPGPGDAPPLEE
jgi:uncharacterized protein (DUF302 family)